MQKEDRLEIRRKLGKVLEEVIGNFANGMPSIYIDRGAGDPVPAMGTGLLVLLEGNPIIKATPIMGSQVEHLADWVVRLIQHDRSPPGLDTFDRALDLMRTYFPRGQERILPPIDGGRPQATFLLRVQYLIQTR